VHVDLDVLDPTEFASTCYPEPQGLPLQRLTELVSRVDNVVGVSITEHAPSDDTEQASDADVIRQLGKALQR
jgi:arginase